MAELAVSPPVTVAGPAAPLPAAQAQGGALHLLLDLDAAAAAALKRDPATLLRPDRRAVTRKLRQLFWDTADHAIGRAGFATGFQTTGRRRAQLILDLRQSPEGGRRDVSQLAPLDGETLDLARLAFMRGFDASRAAALVREMLVPLFAVDLTRTVWRVTLEDAALAVTLEQSEIETAAGRATLLQLDIGLVSGAADAVYRFVRQLSGRLPFRLAVRDPAQQGYRLAVADEAWPWPAPAGADLDPTMTLREGFLAVGRAATAAFRAEMRLLETDLQPERIHQARVAIRRLRSILSVFADALPPLSYRQFSTALGKLAAALGHAREWDVWLSETMAPLSEALGPEPILTELANAALDERHGAARGVEQILGGNEVLLLSLGLGAWFDAGIWPEHPDDTEQALLERNLLEAARDLLRSRHRKLTKAADGLMAASPERLHELRIRAKKLRYSAELLRPLFPGRPVRRYLAALREIQDVLGAANDAVVARTRLPPLAASDPAATARAEGLIAGWTAAQGDQAKRRFAQSWETFLAERRFWRS